MFDKYKWIKKSKSELETEKILSTINNKFWNDNGFMTIYSLGAILQLETIAKILSKYDRITKHDILVLIKSFEEYDDVANLAATILEKYEYKED